MDIRCHICTRVAYLVYMTIIKDLTVLCAISITKCLIKTYMKIKSQLILLDMYK